MGPLERWFNYFAPYQLAWVRDESRVAICCKSRQIGYSWATAGAVVYWALVRKRPQIVLSASQPLSDEVLAKARAHAELLEKFGLRGATKFKTNNSSELSWPLDGARIMALPANPRTARSFSCDVWIDEAAHIQDLEGIREAVFPMVSRGDLRLRIVSTPLGSSGLYYDWWTNRPKTWTPHRTTVDDAAAQGFPVDREKLMEVAGGDERVFAQWYLCSFLDSDTQYIPTAVVDESRRWAGSMPSLERADIFAGLDVGRNQDKTALVVVAVQDGIAWVLAVMTCSRTRYEEQRVMIRHARKEFGWEKLLVDAQGIGSGISEQLVDEFGESEVIPYALTHKSKEEMVTRSYRWFARGRVRLPKDEDGATLARQAIALRRVITPSGNITYPFGQDGSSHSDELCGLFLALHAAGEPPPVRGVGTRPVLAVA